MMSRKILVLVMTGVIAAPIASTVLAQSIRPVVLAEPTDMFVEMTAESERAIQNTLKFLAGC